jgi:5-oxoprolinase (ATP-hydrolysing) subunit A
VLVDLNADVGEGFPDDQALFELVTSANVACGVHAGSVDTMRAACAAAIERGVAIGAHPSFADRGGFGRRELDTRPDALRVEVAQQVHALRSAAAAEGASIAYLKPHGALYHRASADEQCAAAIAAAAADHGLAVLGWPGSRLLEQAQAAGLAAVPEGFADRGYTEDGAQLLARGTPGALLEPDRAARQAVELARGGTVRSICIHGDSPGASTVAARVCAALAAAGVELRRFA